MFIMIAITTLNSVLLVYIGYVHFKGLDWQSAIIIGVAVSFSSTVCATKVLEDRGEVHSRHGQVAIGILVIQGIAAVLFVTFASDSTPSWWALFLLALPLFRPLLYKLLQHSGHIEILALAGLFFIFTGDALFELVGLKQSTLVH
ncbi:MAG: glutathione-regulated potassium-efflux system ancillary protein KefC [Cognaticolwellia sp.]|jgi:glutathione-regulated potassium-efflux system ancillary protein KefC